MALVTATWVLAAASSCFMIDQPDERAYCLAKQNQRATDWMAGSQRTTAQLKDARRGQSPAQRPRTSRTPFTREGPELFEHSKSASPHCPASIYFPVECLKKHLHESIQCNNRRNPPANVRIKGTRGESCAKSRHSKIPPGNEPRDQPARTHPALSQGKQPKSPIRSSCNLSQLESR